MDLNRVLSSIGSSIFVKYYYNFENMNNTDCAASISEPYTDKSKSTRTGHAKRIFRESMQKEALQLIIKSNKLSDMIKRKAKEILDSEI